MQFMTSTGILAAALRSQLSRSSPQHTAGLDHYVGG